MAGESSVQERLRAEVLSLSEEGKAATALCNLCDAMQLFGATAQSVILKGHGMPIILKLLFSESDATRQAAASCLWALLFENPFARVAFVEHDGVVLVVSRLTLEPPMTQRALCGALRNSIKLMEAQIVLLESDGLGALCRQIVLPLLEEYFSAGGEAEGGLPVAVEALGVVQNIALDNVMARSVVVECGVLDCCAKHISAVLSSPLARVMLLLMASCRSVLSAQDCKRLQEEFQLHETLENTVAAVDGGRGEELMGSNLTDTMTMTVLRGLIKTYAPSSCILWDPDLKGPILTLSADCRTVTTTSSVDSCVIGTEANVPYFEIKALDTGGGVRGCSAWFGYVAKEHYSPSGNPSQCAKTQPWHSMSETDIFGCGLDLASRRVHFFKNGEPSGGTSSLPVGPTEFYPFIAHFTRAIAFQTHEVESVPEILRS